MKSQAFASLRWQALTASRKPKWRDLLFLFGWRFLIWKFASFAHYFGERYRPVPYWVLWAGVVPVLVYTLGWRLEDSPRSAAPFLICTFCW